MIVLGVILLIIGFVATIKIIWILGIIAVVIGAVLASVIEHGSVTDFRATETVDRLRYPK